MHRNKPVKSARGSLLDIYWTFGSPATSFDDSSNEALSLLLLMLPVHTLCRTHSAHHAVLPASLTHQDLLHCIFIQHRLWKVHREKKIQRKVTLCMVCCSVMCGAQSHQWDGVNLLGRERKHQPAQMFHIPNVPI